MTGKVLVFPAGQPDGLRFREEASLRGQTVVGASSLAFDPVRELYDDWAILPYVHEDGFESAFIALVRGHAIAEVYAPHEVIFGVVSRILNRYIPDVRLLGTSPLSAKEREYRRLHEKTHALINAPDWVVAGASARPRPSGARLSGLLRTVDLIAGMTNDDKIAVVIELFRTLPQGDIVEIGSWWGRSAALFVLLAHHYDIGSVLCVDPWRAENLAQGVDVLDKASEGVDADEAFSIFQTNLTPLANGRLNYIRAESVDGAKLYAASNAVDSEAFGRTHYQGQIALLHIDGNHSFEHADADAKAWTPYVAPGGVIVFDDYVWAFGDGPKRVGDAFIAANAHRIEQCFVMGTALFVRLSA
ncbi:class I SAM-dependent methyltransferase [Asticcacaulis sp.]|uniref:class I SAM-dependent methyltransferase n=1 Tax=Asticcacaulis sp. TaxID=1872648 RepID=UPI00391B24D4